MRGVIEALKRACRSILGGVSLCEEMLLTFLLLGLILELSSED